MKRYSAPWIPIVVLLAIVVLRVPVFGQTAASNQDTLAALLVEVHGLRAAMEQMASAGPRVQLAFGRLQMQEQRVNSLVRRADDFRAQITQTQDEIVRQTDALEKMQRALQQNVNLDERNQLESQMPFMKRQIAQRTAELQRLNAEEADAASQLTAEQSRWTEINQRLEELERALAK
jgi:predicted  nucleic acid-binding Zn-ribbon protein